MLNPRDISVLDFDYSLPEEKIARYPLAARDQSKLLVWRRGKITDTVFTDAGIFLEKGTMLVFNQTRVIQARLFFTGSDGERIEVFCLEPDDVMPPASGPGQARWKCLVGRLRHWKEMSLFLRNGNIVMEARQVRKEENYLVIDFRWEPEEKPFAEVLGILGRMPIPPYLKRDSEPVDTERYQTVFARESGSVAAPTAGLHFTPEMIRKLETRGVFMEYLTLHVGSGTFRPVKAEKLGDHEMHSELFTITVEFLASLVEKGNRVIAVGTTSVRALESLYWLGLRAPDMSPSDIYVVAQWEPYEGDISVPSKQALLALLSFMKLNGLNSLTCRTGILIAPPYRLRICTGMFTNFHQPRSTLLLLVAAVTGNDWKRIYEHAIGNGYRFLSYGDSSLLLP